MSVQFKTLFSVKLLHEYYADIFADLILVVPEATAIVLKNGKILVRELDGVYHFLCEFQENNIPVIELLNQSLQFGLKLSNPYFFNFTDIAHDKAVSLYNNSSLTSSLNIAASVIPTGRFLTHFISHEDRPVTLSLESIKGNVISTETITSEHTRNHCSFEFENALFGAYRVKETYPETNEVINYYYHQEIFVQPIFSLIEIKIDSSFYTSPPEFTIQFDAKKEKLNYYIIADKYSPTDFLNLQITDTGFVKDSRSEVTFERVETDNFGPTEFKENLLGKPDSKVTLFRSLNKVNRQHKSRKNIQLSLNGQMLISNLPAPGQEKTQANFIIHLANP
ncbi:hypothetical protein [Candidatus Colwellia aromaticivorans]|uniref:hypothetical protein n=1 Tax=Candidatus Colwellia aromaticivorans TaxID=2267621 RepID=UPI000DF31C92|nr:hypothetical protein [Candidatus Colwellia aromaticivorans]